MKLGGTGTNSSWDEARFFFSRIAFLFFLAGNLLLHLLRQLLNIPVIIAILLLPLLLTSYSYFSKSDADLTSAAFTTVRFPAGSSFRQIADSLERYDLLQHKEFFLLLGKITGKERNVRAGVFNLPRGCTDLQMLNYLESARTALLRVTLPEGIQSSQMAGILQRDIKLDSARFVSLVEDSSFAGMLVAGATTLEGYLLPETYLFEPESKEEMVIRRLVQNTLEIFATDSVQHRMEAMGYDQRQILTLASIVEGEALIDAERDTISSLYLNRIRIGMPLQADPTIQFILPGPPRRLLFKDLEVESPYNTYKYMGLPPGPINNPGKNSILATLFPATTPYLYMVAIGNGRHHFSTTLKEHNYWHKRFNEVRRQTRRNNR